MKAIVQQLVLWGTLHLAMPPPSRIEIVAGLALLVASLAGVLFLVTRDRFIGPLGLVTLLALFIALLVVHTAALRLAHHRLLESMR